MHSLFWKIFLAFLLTILLVVSAVLGLTLLRDREFPPLAHQDFMRQAIAEYGRQAIRAYEREGIGEADELVAELYRDHGIRLLLFDAEGRALTEQHVPRRMTHMVYRAMRSGEVVFPMMGGRNSLASVVRSESGHAYVVAIVLPHRPPPGELLRNVTHGFLGWHLLLLLLVTAAACWILARSLSAPISRLRHATRQFASGELATRIGTDIRGQNEIAGLARDFDDMAGKIQGLVDSQQRLLRDISHELRSPLARLGVALELARQENDPARRSRALARIERESERMNDMIGQLLSLTRLDSADVELQSEPFDLTELLRRLVQDADFEAGARQCEIVCKASGQVLFRGSRELLARAFENVIRNALHYTPEGGRVTVDLRAAEFSAVVRIADQGPGVPDAALEKLFDPFFRVADARDRQSGGTGIGLAIAERAVRLHGGTIRARNREQGGLLVEIVLPFQKSS